MSGVGVGQTRAIRIVAAQEHGGVLLRRRAAKELVIQRGHQQRRRKFGVAVPDTSPRLPPMTPAPIATDASVRSGSSE